MKRCLPSSPAGALYAAALLILCGAPTAQRQVQVASAATQDITTHQSLQAEVHAENFARVVSRVTGIVASIAVQEGDRLEADALLATLSCPDLDANLAIAEADRAAAIARAEATRARTGPLRAEVEVANAGIAESGHLVTVAEAQLQVARTEAQRARALFKKAAVTSEQVERADAELARRRAALASAQAATQRADAAKQRCVSDLEAQGANVRAAEAAAAQATAALELARTQRQFATLRNPYPQALVARRHVDPGAHVTADQTVLFEILDPQRVRVRAMLPEADATAVRAGAKAKIWRSGGLPSLDATITRVAGAIDPMSRAMPIEVVLDNDGSWLHGALCTMDVTTRELQDAVTVPRTALHRADGARFVWVVDAGGTTKRRGVRTGVEVDGKVQIVDGLAAGEDVIVQGAAGLEDGATVKFTKVGG